MKIHGIVVCVMGAALFLAAPSRADSTQGLCNALVAQALGTGIQVANQGPTAEQCTAIESALGASLAPPCLDLVINQELGILKASNSPTGELSNLGVRICSALSECGFTPLPFDLCPGF